MSLRAASAAIGVAGLGIAGYLAVVHYTGSAPVCTAGGGCELVQSSAYSKLAGVPVATLGVLGYLALLASLWRDGERARTVTAFLALAGFGFSAWLTYVSHTEIGALCAWCVGSAVCMTLLAGLSSARVVAGVRPASGPHPDAS